MPPPAFSLPASLLALQARLACRSTQATHRTSPLNISKTKSRNSREGTRVLLPKNKVKLLLNMLLIGNAAIPRGGSLAVRLEGGDTEPRFVITVKGRMLRVPPKFLELHSGAAPEEPIDAHSVQPYYTLLLAEEAGMKISIHATAEDIVFSAE